MNRETILERELFPARATLDQIIENSRSLRSLFTVFLVGGLYIFLTAETVTHRQLFNPDAGMALPQIGLQHNVVSFFWAAPLLLVLAHLYFVLHVSQFVGSLRSIEMEYRAKAKGLADGTDPGARLRPNWENLVPPSMIALVALNRKGASRPTRWLITQFVVFTHYLLIIPVLIRIQVKFLPYHHLQITEYLHKPLVILVTIYCIYYMIELFKAREFFSENDPETDGTEVRKVAIWMSRIWNAIWMTIILILGPLFSLGPANFPTTQQENEAKLLFPFKQIYPLVKFTWEANESENESNEDDDEIKINLLIDRNLKLPNEDLARAPSDSIQSALLRNNAGMKSIFGKSFQIALLDKYKYLDMTDRDLNFANFKDSDLRKIRFTRSRLIGANLEKAHLEGALLNKAHLEGANLYEAYLDGSDLGESYLEGANLGEAQMEGAHLGRTHLEGAYLGFAHLEGAALGLAHLEGAYLEKAYLEGTNLSGVHLEGAYLGEAQMEGATLEKTFLKGADLKGAFLEGANLSGAYLEGADLRHAHIDGTDFEQASFGVLEDGVLEAMLKRMVELNVPLNVRKKFSRRLQEAQNTTTQFEFIVGPVRIRHSGQTLFENLSALSQEEALELRRDLLQPLLCKHPAIVKREVGIWPRVLDRDEIRSYVSLHCEENSDLVDQYFEGHFDQDFETRSASVDMISGGYSAWIEE